MNSKMMVYINCHTNLHPLFHIFRGKISKNILCEIYSIKLTTSWKFKPLSLAIWAGRLYFSRYIAYPPLQIIFPIWNLKIQNFIKIGSVIKDSLRNGCFGYFFIRLSVMSKNSTQTIHNYKNTQLVIKN